MSYVLRRVGQAVIVLALAYTAAYLLLAALTFAAFYLGARLLRNLVRRLSERTQRGRNVALVFGRLSQSLLIFVGLLVSLSIVLPSFRASDLIQLLGISSVAIGFAFR